jgi:hypothetical protein
VFDLDEVVRVMFLLEQVVDIFHSGEDLVLLTEMRGAEDRGFVRTGDGKVLTDYSWAAGKGVVVGHWLLGLGFMLGWG